EAARSAIDCLFGRNATGYCYLTGFGTRKVMHPHHRISAADGIGDPLPGLLAGGANAGKQDAASV
ncbi:MAG TPA: cellulase, partial [Prevotellaceae bacterium]|nr:cellulase [Prevotellaceae bacterium]